MDIYPVKNNTITAPGNFDFICNATIDFDLSLIIDGMANSTNYTKFDRIDITNMTTTKETVFQYTFMNTVSTDNGTIFSCIAINSTDGTPFQSDNLTLQVYCEFLCVCVCLSLSACLSACLPACLPVCVYLPVSVCLFVREYGHVHVFVCLFTYLPTYLPACLSACLFLCIDVFQSICVSVCLPVCLCLSVCLSTCFCVFVC